MATKPIKDITSLDELHNLKDTVQDHNKSLRRDIIELDHEIDRARRRKCTRQMTLEDNQQELTNIWRRIADLEVASPNTSQEIP